MSYSRGEFIDAIYRVIGNPRPHPWMRKWLIAWTQIETAPFTTNTPGALNNLLNTTEPGYGSILFPDFNSVRVKNYPTFEDGIAATVRVLRNGDYPSLLIALINNDGTMLGAKGMTIPPEIQTELSVWSGGTNYAQSIADIANSGSIEEHETFPGRRVGEQY